LPIYPTLFAKFAQSLVGANDPVEIPYNSRSTDWEVELVLVAQGYTRHGTEVQAAKAIAGFTVGNDVSERTYQSRTTEWLQGKSFDRTTPLGPVLVTADDTGVNPDLPLRCLVDGVTMQSSRTSDMIFSPAQVVAYVSSIMTLEPGDLIFLGTPSGVGSGRDPAEHLTVGSLLTSEIDGIGRLDNLCVEGQRPALSPNTSAILTSSA
jgi:acylpyruvate hydrolase